MSNISKGYRQMEVGVGVVRNPRAHPPAPARGLRRAGEVWMVGLGMDIEMAG